MNEVLFYVWTIKGDTLVLVAGNAIIALIFSWWINKKQKTKLFLINAFLVSLKDLETVVNILYELINQKKQDTKEITSRVEILGMHISLVSRYTLSPKEKEILETMSENYEELENNISDLEKTNIKINALYKNILTLKSEAIQAHT